MALTHVSVLAHRRLLLHTRSSALRQTFRLLISRLWVWTLALGQVTFFAADLSYTSLLRKEVARCQEIVTTGYDILTMRWIISSCYVGETQLNYLWFLHIENRKTRSHCMLLAGLVVNTVTSHHCGPGLDPWHQHQGWYMVVRKDKCFCLGYLIYSHSKTTEMPQYLPERHC